MQYNIYKNKLELKYIIFKLMELKTLINFVINLFIEIAIFHSE